MPDFQGFIFTSPYHQAPEPPECLFIFRFMESLQRGGHFRVVGYAIESFQGQDPPLRALAWTSKISEHRRARTSLIWAGENETLKKSGVFPSGTLSSHAEKREFVLEMSGSGTNNSFYLRHSVNLRWCVFYSVLRVVESSVHLR